MTGTVILILRFILLAFLYGFLAWALYLIWRDLKAQSQSISAPFIPTLSLTLLDTEEGAEQQFSEAEIFIGRSVNNDFPISHDTVSARHSRLSYHHNQWWLEDLNSTNGTYLNDERVMGPTVVVSGDELRCGQINMLIRLADKTG
jgi:pSer/pThr/pTyr-binding forkhead associated (FHA) protein